MLMRFIKLIFGKGWWHIEYYKDSGAEWHFETDVYKDRSVWYVLKAFISDSWHLSKHSKKQW